MSLPPVVAVVGPTAAGKSDLAVELALAVGGEVVSADAMQLYRGMDVGTAKLTLEERRGVPHHLLDLLDVRETATVAAFQALARAAVEDCRTRGVVPVVVGGSALYVRAVLDRFDFPGTDAGLRHALEDRAADVGPEELHRQLAERDPEAAARIPASNVRRVVRALEVVELTGRAYSARLPERRSIYPEVRQVGLDVPRDVLDRRIEERVERMWRRGLVAEVRDLERAGLREGRTASRALGYAQVLDLLRGRLSEAEARLRTAQATRRFARRQMSWFAKDERVTWVRHDRTDLLAAVRALLR